MQDVQRRVLIVVSSFTPAMPANVHRARVLAWTLLEEGWGVEILTPAREFQRSEWIDPDAESFFPSGIVRHEAKPVLTKLFQCLGMKGITWRALLPMHRLGIALLTTRRFDLVYVTTTTFTLFCLGRLWRRRFGVPYVLDFQDPWYRADLRPLTTKHWFKLRIGQWLSKYLEAFAVRRAAGLVAVSPMYISELEKRYPSIDAIRLRRTAVIPFGVLPRDLDIARRQAAPACEDVLRFITYVGVGAAIMRKSFRRLVEGMARLRQRRPDVVDKCRIVLRGTQGDWKSAEIKILFEEAVAAGVGDLVDEDPRIVSYSSATRLAVEADGLLVLGVDEPAYMPSKLFLYAFTGKPLLACLHWQSQANDYFKRLPELGVLIHFNAPSEIEMDEDLKLLNFLNDTVYQRVVTRSAVWAEYSASATARMHADLFQQCLRA